jgi:hypothetical protein
LEKIVKKQKQKNHVEKHCSNQQYFLKNYKTKFLISLILKKEKNKIEKSYGKTP